MVEPEVGGEGVVRYGGDDAVFEVVTGGEAEDADGLDAEIVVGGGVDDRGIGLVGDGAGENVGGAAAGMCNVDEGNFDGFEGAVVVEIKAGELLDAEFVVDVHASVDFLAAIAVGFEAVAGIEELDLSGVLCFLRGNGFFNVFLGRFFRWLRRNLLRERDAYPRGGQQHYRDRRPRASGDNAGKLQGVLEDSVEAEPDSVKPRM